MNEIITTAALTKRFGSLREPAVDQLDLHVRRGEVYGLLGPNGAGKTTTLRMLLGLQRPTAGTATVLDRPPGHPEGLARLGALVEEPAYYPYMSGRDNLRAIARYTGVDTARIGAVLTTVGLLERADDKVKSYSFGMRQRLGVAAALLKDPELLILDEPTNGLDPASIAAMRELVRSLGTGDRTVVLSSHQLGEVEQVCDRVGVIQAGRLIAEGPVAELRGTAAVWLVAEPVERALHIASSFEGVEAVHAENSGLRILLDPGRAADLNATLVQAGVRVSELRPLVRSLEDVFLELTGPTSQEVGS
ncbi:ABC transporter ATP-binding protein [soil metagenome]